MKRILGINSIRKCENMFMRNYITVNTVFSMSLLYPKLFYCSMPKITKINDKGTIQEKDKGIVYLTFHFVGNFEGIVYYLSQKYDECYFVYSDNFVEDEVRKNLGLETIESISSLKYLKYYNKNFNLIFIHYKDPAILLKMKSILDEKKTIVMLFDEFDNISKKEVNGQRKYVEYKIDNKTFAIAPKALLTIVARTNALIVPIISLRKGFIRNNVEVFESIAYNKANDSVVENERVLKGIYDALLYCLRDNYIKYQMFAWKLFREGVYDRSPIREIDDNDIIMDNNYQACDDAVVCRKVKKSDVYLLIKIENFRIIKVDKLTANIFQCIKRKNALPSNFLKPEKRKIIKERLGYLLKSGYVSHINGVSK